MFVGYIDGVDNDAVAAAGQNTVNKNGRHNDRGRQRCSCSCGVRVCRSRDCNNNLHS